MNASRHLEIVGAGARAWLEASAAVYDRLWRARFRGYVCAGFFNRRLINFSATADGMSCSGASLQATIHAAPSVASIVPLEPRWHSARSPPGAASPHASR
jgi:hypothetical protein